MRFITIIAALATTIAPTSGAANALDPRSDVPCRPEQEMDLRCGAFAIEICEQRNGGRYWTTFRTCGPGEACIEILPGEPRCRPYIADCYPWCKIANVTVNGTDTDNEAKGKETE